MPHSNLLTSKILLLCFPPNFSYLSTLSLTMAITMFSLISILLLFISFESIDGVRACQENNVLHLQKIQYEQLGSSSGSGGVSLRTPCHPHKSRREKGTIIMEMKHKDYCLNNMINRNIEKMREKHLILDHLHVQSLQSRIKHRLWNKNSEDVLPHVQIPLNSGIQLQTLNYIVRIKLGGRQMTVIVDTGSDVSWVQCQPCKLCYNQQEPIFNPSNSSTYKSIFCNSTTCQSLQFATGYFGVCSVDSTTPCPYVVSYADGSYTRGVLAHEKLSFDETTSVSDFLFGCGTNNTGLFGGVSGLMGLGRSEFSLISQTSNIFGGMFSYCLPSLTQLQVSGSLTLGDDVSVFQNTTPISYTNMVSTNPQLSTFYTLNLTAISIGGVDIRTDENPTSFNARNGVVIDSGTVITRLVPSVYNPVKAEFIKQCSEFPTAPPFSILDTCYNLSMYDEVNIPTLKMKFEGEAELVVDVTGVFYFVKADASQVCLALASLAYEDEIMLIGNFQQKNTRVVYDTKGSKVGFAQETCSFG